MEDNFKKNVPGQPVEEDYHYREYTLFGIEDVNVPVGMFTALVQLNR